MFDNDYHNEIRIQHHASLIDQAQSLRGLRFNANGSVWEFMVFATKVNTLNEILISGICTKEPGGSDTRGALNKFFHFNLSEIVLTPDSLKTLNQRLCRDAGDPNWGTK